MVLLVLVGFRLALGLARVKTAGARLVNRDWPLDTAEEMGLVLNQVRSRAQIYFDSFSQSRTIVKKSVLVQDSRSRFTSGEIEGP